jgi:hypothetical protein
MKQALGISLLVTPLLVLAAGGQEDFEGPYAKRRFNVHHFDGTRHVVQSVEFPDFDPLLNNKSAQSIQFSIQDYSIYDHISTVAQIQLDPININSANHVVWLSGTRGPVGKARNEIHYSRPYDNKNQPNGTRYTFAFRFYTPAPWPGRLIMMQGYARYPWLRIQAREKGELALSLAQCGGTIGSCSAGVPPYTGFTFKNRGLGRYKVGSWNTVVLHVLHDNRPDAGRIDVYLNGKKTTYSGRTTYATNSTEVPWLKAGPYGSNDPYEIYYDDVYWRAGFVQPYNNH